MQNKTVKLTERQREIFELIKQCGEEGIIRRHIKPNNSVCFRLMDKDFNPVKNISMSIVERLEEKKVIHLQGHDYKLTATSELV